MPNLLENLLVHALAGGMRGGLEGLLTQKELEERALAETMGRGEGVVSVNDLAALMRGGWTGRPDIDFQLSPYGEFNPMEHRTKGYAYMESPQTKARREQKEKVEAQLNKSPEWRYYRTLKDALGYEQTEAENLTKMIFGQIPWKPEKVEPVSEEDKMTKMYDIARGYEHAITPTTRPTIGGKPVPSGEFGKRAFQTALEPTLLRRTLEKKGMIEKPTAEPTYAPTEKEKLAQIRIRIKNKTASQQDKYIAEQSGIDPDTGEPKEKKTSIYPPEVEIKRKEAEAIISSMSNKDIDEITDSENLLLESAQTYLDSTTQKYGSSAFMGAMPQQTIRPEDEFINEIKSKNITQIHWDKIKQKYPDWDIEYIRQQLGM